MDEIELSSLIQHFPKCDDIYLGSFAHDELFPQTMKSPRAYIINTGTQNSPGEHWYSVYIFSRNGKQICNIFDSLGSTFNVSSAVLKSLENVDIVSKNPEIYQDGVNSVSCGIFCVWYIVHRSHGVSHNNTLSMLTPYEYINNESIIRSTLEKRAGNDCSISY